MNYIPVFISIILLTTTVDAQDSQSNQNGESKKVEESQPDFPQARWPKELMQDTPIQDNAKPTHQGGIFGGLSVGFPHIGIHAGIRDLFYDSIDLRIGGFGAFGLSRSGVFVGGGISSHLLFRSRAPNGLKRL